MPHNPRRSRSPEPDPAVSFTKEQIAGAIDRALEIRRRTAVNATDVSAQPMNPHDAVRSTEAYRYHSHSYRRKHLGKEVDDPWYQIGWIEQVTRWDFVTDLGHDHYCQIWEVWLSVSDGRVWLKYDRSLNWPDEDDPYL